MREESLDQIGVKHGTDKSSVHHDYLHFYERLLSPLRHQENATILEIGIYEGASLKTWEEFFSRALIIGLDIHPQPTMKQTTRCQIEQADQSNALQILDVGVRRGPFDVVIDDGSHRWDHQIDSFRLLFPFVKAGGYYILEDLDTSYGDSYTAQYKGLSPISAAGYLHVLADYVTAGGRLDLSTEQDTFLRNFAPITDYILFRRGTAVIKKSSRTDLAS